MCLSGKNENIFLADSKKFLIFLHSKKKIKDSNKKTECHKKLENIKIFFFMKGRVVKNLNFGDREKFSPKIDAKLTSWGLGIQFRKYFEILKLYEKLFSF